MTSLPTQDTNDFWPSVYNMERQHALTLQAVAVLEGDCPLSLEGQPQLERREGMTPPPTWCLELNGVELAMNYPIPMRWLLRFTLYR